MKITVFGGLAVLIVVAATLPIGRVAAEDKTKIGVAPQEERAYPAAIKSARKSLARVVAFTVNDQGKPIPLVIGTAFVVGSDGLVASARHVTAPIPQDQIYVVAIDRDRVDQADLAHVVAEDTEHDLVLLRAPRLKGSPALPLGRTDSVEEGTLGLVMGFPMSDPILTSTRAMASAKSKKVLRGAKEATELPKLDGAINIGNSGGPFIALDGGRVLGVVNMKEGRPSERLAVFRDRKPTPGIEVKIRMDGLDPIGFMQETVRDMERNLNLGLGYAVAAEYVQGLIKKSKGP